MLFQVDFVHKEMNLTPYENFFCTDKAAADANAAAWAAYYAQYGQQPQASMTPSSGAPGTAQPNGQGERSVLTTRTCF